MDPAVGDQLGHRDARDLAPDGVEPAEDDGLRGVVDDQVDARLLLDGPDVPPLAADDPALHLVARQMDDGDRVLRGVVRCDALHRRDDDVAGLVLGLFAGMPLDRAGELDGVVLGLFADGLEQHRLGVVAAHPRHALQRDDALLVQAAELVTLMVELPLALDELAVLLFQVVGALVELLVAGEEAPFQVAHLLALRADFVLGLAEKTDLLLLGLDDELLLAGRSLRREPVGILARLLHGLG